MRTDRTYVCTDCRLRLWPVARCPGCQRDDALADLEKEPAAIERHARADEASTMPWLAVGGVGASVSIGLLVVAVEAVSLGVAELAAIIGLPSALAMVLGGRGSADAKKRVERARATPYSCAAGPVVRDDSERASLTGTVIARAGVQGTLRAPISGTECIAFRLVGEGPRGAIDDARAERFDLARDAGAAVLVDARLATIALEPDSEPLSTWTVPADTAWLGARGIAAGDTLRVREIVLRAGERVVVEGSTEERVRASGYRSDVLLRARDLPGSPLVIRRVAREVEATSGGGPTSEGSV